MEATPVVLLAEQFARSNPWLADFSPLLFIAGLCVAVLALIGCAAVVVIVYLRHSLE